MRFDHSAVLPIPTTWCDKEVTEESSHTFPANALPPGRQLLPRHLVLLQAVLPDQEAQLALVLAEVVRRELEQLGSSLQKDMTLLNCGGGGGGGGGRKGGLLAAAAVAVAFRSEKKQGMGA
ncbi:hypothetical protein Vretimale_19992 [Volvox reticuliferus]|uniref:Uncharacterized protein n=1 Tax=Volvox reticuliferus TaxID=1737510 RepID=A0A8J4H041_9CHLO|nr:hypothetical protein Vretimale_19992 [Volvox reticuliferus]